MIRLSHELSCHYYTTKIAAIIISVDKNNLSPEMKYLTAAGTLFVILVASIQVMSSSYGTLCKNYD